MQTRGSTVALDKPIAGLRSEGDAGAARLILVSNRGPVEHYYEASGVLRSRCAAGGVATTLSSLTGGMPLTWIANATSAADRSVALRGGAVDVDGCRLRLVAQPQDAYDLFYGTFCNPLLWFLQHALWDRLEPPRSEDDIMAAWQRGYLPVNLSLAEAVVEELDRDGGGRVMLHDYHLYVAPLFIRNLRPDAVLQQFVHIPWPEPEAWRRLPAAIVESICEGLLANDSVVFQTERSVDNFVMTCQAFLPDVRVDARREVVKHTGQRTRVWWNPVSVDIWDLRASLASPEAEGYREQLAARPGERTIVRVDRLDPSKNAAAGFRAYGRLLDEHPEWAGRVRFLACLVPSRTTVPEYRAYAAEVFAEIEAVNARHGRPGWTPITALYEHNRLQALVAMRLYDVLLVNPVIDGMNLVAKEGPAVNERSGVLVLSTTAGAFAELGDAALAVAPDDIAGTAEALHRALSLEEGERRRRAQRLRETILRHDLSRWLRLLLEDLEVASGGSAPVGAPPRELGRVSF